MFLITVFSSSLIPSTFPKLNAILGNIYLIFTFIFSSLTLIIIITASTLVNFVCITIYDTLLITSIYSYVSYPFILIILAWSHTLCLVTIKYCLFSQMPYIRFLYRLVHFPTSSIGLLKKFMTATFISLNHPVPADF